MGCYTILLHLHQYPSSSSRPLSRCPRGNDRCHDVSSRPYLCHRSRGSYGHVWNGDCSIWKFQKGINGSSSIPSFHLQGISLSLGRIRQVTPQRVSTHTSSGRHFLFEQQVVGWPTTTVLLKPFISYFGPSVAMPHCRRVIRAYDDGRLRRLCVSIIAVLLFGFVVAFVVVGSDTGPCVKQSGHGRGSNLSHSCVSKIQPLLRLLLRLPPWMYRWKTILYSRQGQHHYVSTLCTYGSITLWSYF